MGEIAAMAIAMRSERAESGLVRRLATPDALSIADILGGDLATAVLEHSLDATLLIDEDGIIVHFNSTASRLFGLPIAEVLGCTGNKVIPQPILDSCARWGEKFTEDTQGIRGDGSPLPMRVQVAYVASNGRRFALFYIRDLATERAHKNEVERLAYYDRLTGLANRALLNEHFMQALARAKRQRALVAFLYIDVDKFKAVNDTYGHVAGDRVLREVARRLKACVRSSDTVARLGGDEFAALLTDLRAEEDVKIVGERMLAMCEKDFVVDGGVSVKLGASIGVAVFPRDGETVESLTHAADTAMYHAKDEGRGRLAWFCPELSAAAEKRSLIERGLRRALVDDGLVLHYQPQMDLRTGELVGAEALVRWMDNGSLISPLDFVPVAESSGLIVPIGEWVLREACQEAMRWREAGLGGAKGLRIGVNLSVRQFSPQLPETVFQILEETGFPAALLDLEVTESFLVDNQRAVDILSMLRARGITVSIDDFGTGFSCLAYLRDLPLDTIKIDRSFVRHLDSPSGDRDKAIVESIINMATSLGHETLAEGVETEAQAKVLFDLGCPTCQGFLYSRPVPAEAFRKFAEAERLVIVR